MFSYLIIGNILMAGVFILKLNQLPPQLPLFYSKPWGEDQLGDTWMIVILPLLLNIFYILNNYFYKKYFPGNLFIRKILDYLNLFLIIVITGIFVRIILLIS